MSGLVRRWRRMSVRSKGLLVVALPTVAVVILGAFRVAAEAQTARLERAVDLAGTTHDSLDELADKMLEADYSVRAYLLARDSDVLAPYNTSRVDFPGRIDRLRVQLRREGLSTSELDDIEQRVDEWFILLDRMVELGEPGGPPVDVPARMLDRGDQLVDLLQGDVDALDREVADRLDAVEARLSRLESQADTALAAGLGFGVCGGIGGVVLFMNGVARRVRSIERNARRLVEEEPFEAMSPSDDEIARAGRALDEAAALLAERTRQLRESEQRFRSLVQDAVGLIFEQDLETRFTYVSPSVRTVLGYKPGELIGRSGLEFVHPDDMEVAKHELSAAIREPGTTRSAQVRFRHADGSWRWLMAAGRALRGSEGGAIRLIVNAQDVTDRAEAGRTASRLASIVETSDDAMIATDPNGIVTAWNEGAVRMYGYTAEEIIGRTGERVVPPDRQKELGEIRARVARGERFHLQTVRVARDGKRLDVWLAVAPILDASGSIVGSSFIGRDMSPRMEAERKLVAAERRLRSILNNMGEGVVVADADGALELFNPTAERILGASMLVADRARWEQEYALFRPDGVTRFADDDLPLARALRGEPSDGVEMIVRGGDDEVWVRMTGRPVVDEHGAVVAGVMVFSDVTAAKRVELAREARSAELERSNRELQDIALLDELTKVANRRGFLQAAEEDLASAMRRGQRAVLVFVDVDGLKSINDDFGHDEGSRLLADVAMVLQRTARASDLVGRLSGDEFCVLGTGDVHLRPEALINRLETAVSAFNTLEERPYTMSLSFGAAICDPRRPRSLDDLIRDADERMYEHKRGKRSLRT